MSRLNIVVEGQTEEMFVNKVLSPWLATRGVYCSARCVETSRDKKINKIFRGGLDKYGHLKNDLTLWMKQEKSADVWFTTMIDLYALPVDFPDYKEIEKTRDHFELVTKLESAFKLDVSDRRFIPYIQLHEYEAIVLADPSHLELYFPECRKVIDELTEEVLAYSSPEEINQGQETAPSKRIIKKVPEYKEQKAIVGPLLAEKIGIVNIRNKCKHFDEWLNRLETLGTIS